MRYDPALAFCAVMGIPYDPVWKVAEDCLYWWQLPFVEWLIDMSE